jgi:hypothetical protein
MRTRRWWWRLDPLCSVEDKLDRLLDVVSKVHVQVWRIQMGQTEILARLAEIDAATNNIAADIERLKAQITVGMTPEQVAEVQAVLDAAAVKLQAVAAVVPEPEPEPPV